MKNITTGLLLAFIANILITYQANAAGCGYENNLRKYNKNCVNYYAKLLESGLKKYPYKVQEMINNCQCGYKYLRSQGQKVQPPGTKSTSSNVASENTTSTRPSNRPVHFPRSIKIIQLFLNRSGYNAGTTDGIWGKKTTNALNAYQSSNNIPVTGIIDARTVRSIQDTLDTRKVFNIHDSVTILASARNLEKVFAEYGSPYIPKKTTTR